MSKADHSRRGVNRLDLGPGPRQSAAMLIFKIFRPGEWQAFHTAGETLGAAIDISDGYIHFSTAEQLPETAAKHFADATDLMVLALEADGLGDDLVWETSRGGQLFPHLYRALRLADVIWARPMGRDNAGHVLPEGVGP